MSLCTISVATGYKIDNTQKRIHLYCQLVVAGTVYPVGGIPLDAALLALPEITTDSGVGYTDIHSDSGTGYIYQRIPNTALGVGQGTMMILQVPPNGSLTTGAPLQQIPSSLNMQGVINDIIACHATFTRNA